MNISSTDSNRVNFELDICRNVSLEILESLCIPVGPTGTSSLTFCNSKFFFPLRTRAMLAMAKVQELKEDWKCQVYKSRVKVVEKSETSYDMSAS